MGRRAVGESVEQSVPPGSARGDEGGEKVARRARGSRRGFDLARRHAGVEAPNPTSGFWVGDRPQGGRPLRVGKMSS